MAQIIMQINNQHGSHEILGTISEDTDKLLDLAIQLNNTLQLAGFTNRYGVHCYVDSTMEVTK